MEDVSFVDPGGRIVSVSGVGQGECKGKLVIQDGETTVEISKLTIESTCKPGEAEWIAAKVQKLEQETELDGVDLFFNREHLLTAKANPAVLESVEHIFQEKLLLLNPQKTVLPVRVDTEKVQVGFISEMGEDRAKEVSRWLKESIPRILSKLSWGTAGTVKISHPIHPVHIRCFRDYKTGEIFVQFPAGKFGEGLEKSVKRVFLAEKGVFRTLARIAPQKTDRTLGRKKTPPELVEARASIQKEIEKVREFIQAGVPNIIDIRCEFTFQNKNGELEPMLLTEPCKELFDHLCEVVEKEKITPERRLEFLGRATAIADTLRHLHKLGWVYRDLKLPNILVQGDKTYLTDFGAIAHINDSVGFAGTYNYIAPELLSSCLPASPKHDMWAFGSMLLELIEGGSFFADPEEKLYNAIERHDLHIVRQARLDLEDAIDQTQKWLLQQHEEIATLCSRLISLNPQDRPTADEVYTKLLAYLEKKKG